MALHPAIVLERIAMGGGAVRWFYCRSATQLAQLEMVLRAGSAVSFYFDERIGSELEAISIRRRVEEVLKSENEVMVGALASDMLKIDAMLVSDVTELDEFLRDHAASPRFFCGLFPARDNDGNAAITVVMPDADGVVRRHPH